MTESLAKNHAFYNANKRTALATLIIFLKLNGFQWTMDVIREQDFIINIVTDVYTFEEMTTLIRSHSEPIEM